MVLILLCPWPSIEDRLPLYRVVVKDEFGLASRADKEYNTAKW
jgi:hypothetical protein